jgi:hypothetical protein
MISKSNCLLLVLLDFKPYDLLYFAVNLITEMLAVWQAQRIEAKLSTFSGISFEVSKDKSNFDRVDQAGQAGAAKRNSQ